MKVSIEQKDGKWASEFEGELTPRNITQIIRSIKVGYRMYLRELRMKSRKVNDGERRENNVSG